MDYLRKLAKSQGESTLKYLHKPAEYPAFHQATSTFFWSHQGGKEHRNDIHDRYVSHETIRYLITT